MRPINVAIDSGPLKSGHAVRGVGVYTRELIKAIKLLSNRAINLEDVDFEKEDLTKYDVLHYTYFNPFFITLPQSRFSPGQKIVVTIHDLIPLIYPKQYPPGFKGKIRFLVQRHRLRNVDAIIADSETSKKDIVRFLEVNPKEVYVVHLAVSNVFKPITDRKLLITVRNKYNLPKSFVLYVGDVNYNKNITNLIKACKIVKVHLVICGKQAGEIDNFGQSLKSLKGPRDWLRYLLNIPHPEASHFRQLEKEFKDSSNILRLGFVPDEDLVSIYNLASVYVQPSLYEGFGLPVLEAMSCGCPVVVFRTNALVEIASDAALVADPNSPNDIAKGIEVIFEDKETREELVKKGSERVTCFSWEKTARETVEVYTKVFKRES